jgi:DNA-binding response OmpR family regulator
VNEIDIRLTRTEFALLAVLVQHLDAVLTHDELLAKVWGEEYRGSSHYLHVYLGRIRRKLGDQYGSLFETMAGMGYLSLFCHFGRALAATDGATYIPANPWNGVNKPFRS